MRFDTKIDDLEWPWQLYNFEFSDFGNFVGFADLGGNNSWTNN